MPIEPTEIGPTVQAKHMHSAPLPKQEPGKHLWIVVSVFQVRPHGAGKYQLDMENMLTIEGPCCYWCEQTWEPGAESRPCPGEPNDNK